MKSGWLLLAAMSIAACDPCAGTPSCSGEPRISYTGQTIEFPSGASVSGVRVMFVRSSGVELVVDTVRSTSDGSGMFLLRAEAMDEGRVRGALIVEPPSPRERYEVPGVELITRRGVGDGGFLGRIMVNPYLQFIGELHDRDSDVPITGARVTIRALGPAVAEPALLRTTSADNGRIEWTPKIREFGLFRLQYEVESASYPRTLIIRDSVNLQWKAELPLFRVIYTGIGTYVAAVRRRGTLALVPGVRATFQRTGGDAAQPDQFDVTIDSTGRFDVPIVVDGPDKVLVGDLTIHPPAPLGPETIRDVKLVGFDGDVRELGPFSYGPAVLARPVLVYRATGQPIKAGTHARFTHVGGLPVTPMPWGVDPDSGIRIVDSSGTVGYDVATQDSGLVSYDIEARLNEPHQWETVKAVSFPARASDVNAVDTLRVGIWLPWIGELRDAATNAPVTSASVIIKRLGGIRLRADSTTVAPRIDGTFLVQPEPLERGTLQAQVTIRTAGLYRDTTISITVGTFQDDTVRSIGSLKLQRITP